MDHNDLALRVCLLLIGGIVAYECAVTWIKARKRRNRYAGLPKPRPDDRSSIEYSKPHMPKRAR